MILPGVIRAFFQDGMQVETADRLKGRLDGLGGIVNTF